MGEKLFSITEDVVDTYYDVSLPYTFRASFSVYYYKETKLNERLITLSFDLVHPDITNLSGINFMTTDHVLDGDFDQNYYRQINTNIESLLDHLKDDLSPEDIELARRKFNTMVRKWILFSDTIPLYYQIKYHIKHGKQISLENLKIEDLEVEDDRDGSLVAYLKYYYETVMNGKIPDTRKSFYKKI